MSSYDVRALLPDLRSADSSVRLSTLRILFATSRATSNDSTPSSADVWSLCLQIESSEMSLKNVRERTSHIARLGRLLAVIPNGGENTSASVIPAVLGYLVAQLKVNYRPLYAGIISLLADLAEQHGETIWSVIWQELQKINTAKGVIVVDLDNENPVWATSGDSRSQAYGPDIEDKEKDFRCHNLERNLSAVDRAGKESSDMGQLDAGGVSAQIPYRRLDVLNYEAQLLAALAAIPYIAERHSRVLIHRFLSVVRPDDVEDDHSDKLHLSTQQRHQRTASYLELLANFVNPRAVCRSGELYARYLSILSIGDPKLQKLALRCLMTYKSPKIVPYEANLKNLLDVARFRDELAHFSLAAGSEVISPQHRDEILPVAIRLLYGIITSRRGKSNTAQGLAARKQAVLTAMGGCSPEELSTLIDLMQEPFEAPADSADPDFNTATVVVGRQSLGFLTLLSDVLRCIGPQTNPHWPRLIRTTIRLVRGAQEKLDRQRSMTVGADEDSAEIDQEDSTEPENVSIPLRRIRKLGTKRLAQFFRTATSFNFSPYLSTVFAFIISPRLDKLEIENTQAPSGTLDLIASLAAFPETALALVEYDERTLPKVFACMTAVKVKSAVVTRVFDVVEALLEDDDSPVTRKVLLPHIHSLLENIIGLVGNLKQASNPDMMTRLLSILSRLSTIVTDGEQAQKLASLLGPYLRQSNKQLPEKGKVNMLKTLQALYTSAPDFADPASEFFVRSYELITNLFQTLHFPSSRRALVAVFETFVQSDASLKKVVKLVTDINAYSTRRLDEADFDRRLTAYALLSDAEEGDLPYTTREWLPLLRSALFFLQEPDEPAIRSNASSLIQRFMGLVGTDADGLFVDSLLNIVVPGLRRVLRSKIEPVRNEALQVISCAVKTCTGVRLLAEMRPLLADDEEANFFVNLAHVQVHRRTRALRRLRGACSTGGISEVTLSSIFLPVLEHIVAGSTDVTDHHLVNESVLTIGAIAGVLRWSQYNSLIMRYLRLGKRRSAQQKVFIRVASAIIDRFHFDLTLRASDSPIRDSFNEDQLAKDDLPEGENVHGRGMEDFREAAVAPGKKEAIQDDALVADNAVVVGGLSGEHLAEIITTRLLPALKSFVSQKGETEDSIRIPLALPTVKLASALPGEASNAEILRTVTTVSQILRSKDQNTRDIARVTICQIALFLGPEWLVRVLKELLSALQRGPQKHVAAVVTHAVLVLATSEMSDRSGLLDDAVKDAVQISAEVIWGESGRDVESEGFQTKMREVRGATSRGLDTFQLVSRFSSPSKIGTILAPVRDVMHSSQALKTMQHVDEALRRIALGLNANAQLQPPDVLSLCYSLISGNSSYLKPKRERLRELKSADSQRVQIKRDDNGNMEYYPLNAHKLVAFGLELFVTAFRRGKFALDDVDILARLGPLVKAVGNTLYSPTSSVLVLGLKATAAICRCPLPQVEPALPVFMSIIFKVIKRAGGTVESEITQTALKTLAVIVRDCKASQITDTNLRFLFEVISPHLEEPDRQNAVFAMLRAIVSRRFVVPEIYDLMDRVTSIMVTSQSTHVQEICRGLLVGFLLDYPQGKGRLKAQLTFLARNLDYVFESGRVSVMELLAAVFIKFTDELIEEYADMFFVALVTVLANDEAARCRTMAGTLIQQLFVRMSGRQKQRTLQVLKTWVELRDENAGMGGASLAVYSLLAERQDVSNDVVSAMLTVVELIIEESAARLVAAENLQSDLSIVLDHSLPFLALSAVFKAIQASPNVAKNLPSNAFIAHLLFPHDWVRFAAARLLVTLVSSHTNPPHYLGEDALFDIARKSCALLQGSRVDNGTTPVVEGKLADQLVKLLFSIAKHWATSQQIANASFVDDPEDGGDDEELSKGQPLPWLMSRMSFSARHLFTNRPSAYLSQVSDSLWSIPIMAILRFFAGVFEHFTIEQAQHFLPHVLNPVHRILDERGDSTSKDAGSRIYEVRELAKEVRDLVQSKVGSTNFSRAWEDIRKRVHEKREGRKDARNRLAFADPQAWYERRDRRGAMQMEAKKRKAKVLMDAKHQGRPFKRRAI